MICTKCGKGELQELTGTEMLICPLCSCKLISPNAHQYPDIDALKVFCNKMVDIAKPINKESPMPAMFWYWFGAMQAELDKQKSLLNQT